MAGEEWAYTPQKVTKSGRYLQRIRKTQNNNGQVIALGTTVARAVESALNSNQLKRLASLKPAELPRFRGSSRLMAGDIAS